MYAIRKINVPIRSHRFVESRLFRNFDADSFRADLSLIPWHLVNLESDPNRAWDLWSCKFQEMCDYHAPKRKRDGHARWLTTDVKRTMFLRDKLKRVAHIHNMEADWNQYKIARNAVKL